MEILWKLFGLEESTNCVQVTFIWVKPKKIFVLRAKMPFCQVPNVTVMVRIQITTKRFTQTAVEFIRWAVLRATAYIDKQSASKNVIVFNQQSESLSMQACYCPWPAPPAGATLNHISTTSNNIHWYYFTSSNTVHIRIHCTVSHFQSNRSSTGVCMCERLEGISNCSSPLNAKQTTIWTKIFFGSFPTFPVTHIFLHFNNVHLLYNILCQKIKNIFNVFIKYCSISMVFVRIIKSITRNIINIIDHQ